MSEHMRLRIWAVHWSSRYAPGEPRVGYVTPEQHEKTELPLFRRAFVLGATAARRTGRRGHDARREALRWAWTAVGGPD